jgi:radical SAM protein with 4Fe4S-binding SPASM domain
VPSAAEHERLYRRLADIALDPATTFDVKTTAGQPFYRVLAQERARRGVSGATRSLRAPRGVNDGNGFLFVSHTGEICPSGFLPLIAGNVRTHDVATVYRHHDLFTRLRQPTSFSGKCGRCEYHDRCGGSRSRTYGMTGDPFASDPTCVYQPKAAIN